jgi:hypothetical protein
MPLPQTLSGEDVNIMSDMVCTPVTPALYNYPFKSFSASEDFPEDQTQIKHQQRLKDET